MIHYTVTALLVKCQYVYVYYISNLLNTRKRPRHLLLFFKSSQKKALHPDQSRNTNKIFFFSTETQWKILVYKKVIFLNFLDISDWLLLT